jgi:phosphoglycolate phosphatase
VPYDLCIFDLDGTLTDPKLGITKSFQFALSSFGIHEELDGLTKFIGPPLRESFREHYGFSDSDTEKAVIKFREYFAETGLFENAIYPDIHELLQKLKNRGKTLAVATSKAAFYADRILENFDLTRYFSFVSGDEMDGSLTKNGKQDVIRIALGTLDPARRMGSVMIGDREHDIFGAREVGIDSIGNTWGYGSRDELEAAGSTWIVDSTDELYRLIAGE